MKDDYTPRPIEAFKAVGEAIREGIATLLAGVGCLGCLALLWLGIAGAGAFIGSAWGAF